MHLFGLTALGYMWARMVKAVLARQANGESNPALDAKLTLARFFNERMLPETAAHLARITARRRDGDGASGGGVLTEENENAGGPMSAVDAQARLTGGCQCGAVRYRLDARADRREHLSLPHVPEGERRPVHGLRRRALSTNSSGRSGAPKSSPVRRSPSAASAPTAARR